MGDYAQENAATGATGEDAVAWQLDQARRRREECLATREELRDLLAKAERRRAAEPDQRQKWEQVIGGLESSYAELRLRLEQNETTIRLCERELVSVENAGVEEVSKTAAEEAPPAEVSSNAIVLSDDPAFNLQQILDMPIEELRRLNLEQLGQLCSELENQAEHRRDARRVRARLEFANQLNTVGQRIILNEEGREERRQFILRAAIDKVQSNRHRELERHEIQLLIQCRRQLACRLNPTERDIRLLGLLSNTMAKLAEAGQVPS
jgi:hypothetical protein